MNTREYLEKIRPLTETGSDYAISKMLGVTRQMISMFKSGKRCFPDDVSVRVARVLDLPPGVVLADIHAERTTGEASKVWHQLAVQLRRSAAGILSLALVIGAAGSPAPAEAGSVNTPNTVYYVK
ncbi:MAG: helix-turn-helix transcriptional regulator [Gammaproteobacteria bacterium]|nr:helix-turn-helix transcriptional regulator [Gammaproteobacteria bacterium]